MLSIGVGPGADAASGWASAAPGCAGALGCAGGEPALASPKFGLSAGALVDEAAALSETALVCAHAVKIHTQNSISRCFAMFIFPATAAD
jgi:hypothetical protein